LGSFRVDNIFKKVVNLTWKWRVSFAKYIVILIVTVFFLYVTFSPPTNSVVNSCPKFVNILYLSRRNSTRLV